MDHMKTNQAPDATSSPLMALHASRSSEVPLLCIPGAGASVTSFIALIGALGDRWPVYGFQPRGVDLAEPPHDTVEAAALDNLRALSHWNPSRPVHLLGHSHGGLVAFDMALRLREQGRLVASLTLIDTEPPETRAAASREMEMPEICREFRALFESTYDKTLPVDAAIVASGVVPPFLQALHAALIAARCVPARSSIDTLRGPFATYAAARRSAYTPAASYAGKVHLALVSASRVYSEDDVAQRRAYASAWRRHAPALDVWYGPGHHFSILQPPHVHALAAWWRQARES